MESFGLFNFLKSAFFPSAAADGGNSANSSPESGSAPAAPAFPDLSALFGKPTGPQPMQTNRNPRPKRRRGRRRPFRPPTTSKTTVSSPSWSGTNGCRKASGKKRRAAEPFSVRKRGPLIFKNRLRMRGEKKTSARGYARPFYEKPDRRYGRAFAVSENVYFRKIISWRTEERGAPS